MMTKLFTSTKAYGPFIDMTQWQVYSRPEWKPSCRQTTCAVKIFVNMLHSVPQVLLATS